jgi:hypothetical protein
LSGEYATFETETSLDVTSEKVEPKLTGVAGAIWRVVTSEDITPDRLLSNGQVIVIADVAPDIEAFRKQKRQLDRLELLWPCIGPYSAEHGEVLVPVDLSTPNYDFRN